MTWLPFVVYIVVFFVLGALVIWLTHRAVMAEEARQRAAESAAPVAAEEHREPLGQTS
jgi:sensor domain CHASE-containing protein